MAQIERPQAAPHTDGAVAIEYGLIVPVLLLFTFGIMDMGRLLWTNITLSRATAAAARCGAVDQITCPNAGAIQTYAVTQAWGLNDVTTSTFAVTTPNCGGAQLGVQVVATYTFQFVIPWFFGTAPYGSANTMPLSATACYPRQY